MQLSFLPSRRRGQRGYILLTLTLAVALVLIALAAAVPSLVADLRRQREQEMIHRGTEYTRAIRNYYRKFGAYPITIDQLDSDQGRFLRRRYKDPMTGGDFRPLHVGEVQIIFRQPGYLTMGDASTKQQGDASPFTSISDMAGNNQDFGGAPVIGVASNSPQESFRVFNDKDHYKDWQFVYSPLLEGPNPIAGPFDGLRPTLNGGPTGSPVPLPASNSGDGKMVTPGVPLPGFNPNAGPGSNR